MFTLAPWTKVPPVIYLLQRAGFEDIDQYYVFFRTIDNYFKIHKELPKALHGTKTRSDIYSAHALVSISCCAAFDFSETIEEFARGRRMLLIFFLEAFDVRNCFG